MAMLTSVWTWREAEDAVNTLTVEVAVAEVVHSVAGDV